MKTQQKSAYDTSVGENVLASSALDKITNHHNNTDVRNNIDSQSFETLRTSNFSYSSFGDTIATTTTPQSYTLPPPRKEYPCFQIEGGSSQAAQCDKSRALIKALKLIF